MKISTFNANIRGGIIQFADTVSSQLEHQSKLSKAYYHSEAKTDFSKSRHTEKYKYSMIAFKHSTNVNNVCRDIMSSDADSVWFLDSTLFSVQTACRIKGKKQIIITIHDPTPHPTNEKSIKRRFYNLWKNRVFRKAVKLADIIIALSDESKEKIMRYYPVTHEKIYVLPLGAHIPEAKPTMPDKLKACSGIENGYFLFFGRIDKYKGIEDALKAYRNLKNKDKPFIIAGSGEFTENERKLIDNTENVIVLNEFVSDGCMMWLFEHSSALILPYIEASQSGIIPIAYRLGKPIIVSGVEGLTQFTEKDKTGFICHTVGEYTDAMNKIYDGDLMKKMSIAARDYYSSHLDWENNISGFIKFLEEKK